MYIVIVGNGFTNPLSTQVSAACPSWIHGGVILEQLSVRLSWLSHYTFKRKIFQPSSPSLIRFAKDWKKVTKNPSTCSSGEYLPCPLSAIPCPPSSVPRLIPHSFRGKCEKSDFNSRSASTIQRSPKKQFHRLCSLLSILFSLLLPFVPFVSRKRMQPSPILNQQSTINNSLPLF